VRLISLWSFLVARSRFLLAVLTAALVVSPAVAGPGLFKGKSRPDAARVRTLVETLKNDPDEKKRRAAADELGGADSRTQTEVTPALATALQKDTSASVRVEAAESLGQLNQVSPLAGVALEDAAANDSSPAVRLAAKKALWTYHLNGYHSPKTTDGLAAQTIEPPIASPAGPRPIAAVLPAPPPPAPVTPLIPTYPAAAPTTIVSQLPPVASPTGPRLPRPSFLAALFPGPRETVRSMIGGAPPILNMTSEPPIAKRPAITIPRFPEPTALAPPPTIMLQPTPISVAPSVPDYVPTLPPFTPDLPSVVTPPDITPVAPSPVLSEPKIPATLPPLPG
jgi:hypothetical protein